MTKPGESTPPQPGKDTGRPAVVDRAVKQYMQSWADGKKPSIEEVLDLPMSDQDYMVTRDMVVTAISDITSRVTADLSSEVTSQSGAPGSMDTRAMFSSHGPTGVPSVEGYDITRRLGRGGMGVVFEAVQHATGRRVAIKFLLDSVLESAAARTRFEREVEVVAGLQHTGIVSILDSGIRKGHYFYVMEYVEGKPLDEAFKIGECDPREALKLLAEVCDAVDYAHQHGVLHRDLKPSNIIIDAKGKSHLLDFGLAKRFEDDEVAKRHALTMSQPGQILGTVAYMSPEQSQGKAHETSVRADVYSLGVIGYELIAGLLPVEVDKGSLREVLTRIAETDPRPPSFWRDGIGKDIDAVLLKALEKSPDKRYATAAMFAEDIRRALAYMPVSARRVGPAGRSWRWVRRNRTLSAVIAVAAAVLIGVSTGLFVKIVQERDRANANAENTKQALIESLQNERYANQNFAILKGMLDSTDPDIAGEPTVRQFLDNTSKRLNDSPPELDLTEASVREILGSVYRKLGDYEKAKANLTKALKIREARSKGDNAELATCLHNLAAAEWWEGHYDTAEPLYVRSLDMRRALHPGDNAEVAESLTHLAACRLRKGNIENARELYQQVLDMRRRIFGAEHVEVAKALNNLAKTSLESEDFATAEDLFRQALDMVIRVRGEDNNGTASALQNLAECLLKKGDAVAAKQAYERALRIRRAAYTGGHHLIGASLVGIANADLALNDVSAAEQHARDAIEIYKKKERTNHPDYAEALGALGSALVASGGAAEAEPLLRQALKITAEAKPPSEFQVALLQADLGECLARLAKTDEATQLLEASLGTMRKMRGDNSRITTDAAQRLLAVYKSSGDSARASELEALVQAPR